MKVANFRDLMAGYKTAEITCLYQRCVVRRLTVEGDELKIDACDGNGPVTVKLDAAITYQPWVMDRGSLLFDAADCVALPMAAAALGPTAKLKICGEEDTIVFPDGSTDRVLPA